MYKQNVVNMVKNLNNNKGKGEMELLTASKRTLKANRSQKMQDMTLFLTLLIVPFILLASYLDSL